MAFGFLVEKFDLFLQIAVQSSAGRASWMDGRLIGNIAGLLLIVLGGATMVLAIIRFRKTAADITSPEQRPGTGERTDVTLAGLLVTLGTVFLVYLSYTMMGRL